jgi:AcrR family transcriptional regulator
MAVKSSVRTEKIVDAAAQLFARRGYHGTSTREIARLAEVSENTLFRHFEHKEDIFWSALRYYVSTLKPSWELLGGFNPEDKPEIVLPKIFELLAETVCCRPEVIRIMAVAFLEMQGKAEVICRDLISPVLAAVSRYLASSVEKGAVKHVDPTLLVASLMAMVLIYPQLAKFTNEPEQSALVDNRQVVSAYSKFWLDVLVPARLDSPAERC